MSEAEEIQLNLKWDNFSSHLALSFDSCYESQQFVDVSLVCKDGEVIKGHKMILANTSKFFRRLLTENEHPHPMIVLHTIDADDLRSLMTFMYCGEVQVFQNDLKKLLEIADTLEITGLQQIQELDNPGVRFGVKNFATLNPDLGDIDNTKNDASTEMNSGSLNKSASNLLKYVSTLGQKNLDNSIQTFESSSEKLQQLAKKFEKCSNSGGWSFLRQTPNSNDTGMKDPLNDCQQKTFQRLPDSEPDLGSDFKSSSRKLQEMAKLLENMNRNSALSEVSEGHKRSSESEEMMETPAKRPNLAQSAPNTSEVGHEADMVGRTSAGHDISDSRNDEQLIQNCGVFIKDEVEVDTDGSTTPDAELDNMRTDNSSLPNNGEHSGTTMLAAELLKAVANKRKEMPCTLLSSERKSKRKSWDKIAMAQAIGAVREKKMGLCRAAKEFSVPKTSLHRFVHSTLPPELVLDKKMGRKPVLPLYLERKLIGYIRFMERQYYGLTHADVRCLAYQLAIKSKIEHPFNNNKAGYAWLEFFLKRHKMDISLKESTGASICEKKLNHVAVEKFFDILEREYAENYFAPNRIFSVGEVGFSVVQTKIPEVTAARGKQQIQALTAAERISLVTVVCAMSASGIFVPPMMIFPRRNMTETLMRGAPPGALGRCHPSGWIQTNLFTEWLRHFVERTKPSAASPILLILDGNNSHTKHIDIVDIARENHITIISIPPHSTHRMQPIDKIFMGPLKTYYREEVQKWLGCAERRLSPYRIAELFGRAYRQCQTENVAVNAFQSTGIYPCNRGVFTLADFRPSKSRLCEPSCAMYSIKLDETAAYHLSADISTAPQLGMRNSDGSEKFSPASPHERVAKDAMNHTVEKGRYGGRGSRPSSSRVVEDSDTDLEESDISWIKSDLSISCANNITPHEEETTCIFCDQKYADDNGKVGILCESCGSWAHDNCAGCVTEYYICDFCK